MKRATCWLMLAGLALPLAAQVKLPPYTRQTLPNGVVLVLMPKHDVPLTSIEVLIRGGAESDPADMSGLASVTAELLRRGTATRSADKFSEEADFIGATFQTGSNEQATIVSTEFLSRDTTRALDLITDAVLHPAFPEPEVKKVLAQRIDAAKALKDDPQPAAGVYFRAFFYGAAHPYGRPADELTLARITRDSIMDYHRRMYTAKNMTVIAVGDFDTPAMAARLSSTFSAVNGGSAYAWASVPPPSRGTSPRLLLVDKPDATQTYFWIGQPGINRTHPDRFALWIVNTLFGGRFTSMLNDELRVNSGLTYGAVCRLDTLRLPGSIGIATFTPTETTAEAVDLALDVLKRLGEKGITAEQLASAKAYIKGGYPTQRLETADQLAGVLGEMELYGLGRSEVDDLFSKIDSITLETANAAARKYYRPDGLTFLLLGNAAKIREAARKHAPNIVERPITAPGIR
ncbi:MAG: pitrilysin family protein [Bryobacteraceae bacterium]